ncbi:MAG: hypothetical protein WDO74_00855 [Pseudomonadota bacterium]
MDQLSNEAIQAVLTAVGKFLRVLGAVSERASGFVCVEQNICGKGASQARSSFARGPGKREDQLLVCLVGEKQMLQGKKPTTVDANRVDARGVDALRAL